MADTLISQPPLSSPSNSPSQPLEDQFTSLTLTSEPLADIGGGSDGADHSTEEGSTEVLEERVGCVAVAVEERETEEDNVKEEKEGSNDSAISSDIKGGGNDGCDHGKDDKSTEVQEKIVGGETVVEERESEENSVKEVKEECSNDDGKSSNSYRGNSGGPDDRKDGGSMEVVEDRDGGEKVVEEERENDEESVKEEKEEGNIDDAISSKGNGGGNNGPDDGKYGGSTESLEARDTGAMAVSEEIVNAGDDDRAMNSKRSRFPVREEADVCAFYMRTGMCKFGMNCKFNHPPQVGKVKGKERYGDIAAENLKDKNDFGERERRIDCKYFDRPGGCKFGKTCNFSHSRRAPAATSTSELNFMGLPIRLGEPECPYYMRNGSCKFGVSCRFNHPDPTTGAPDTFPSYNDGGSISSPTALKPTVKPWSHPAALNEKPAYVRSMIPPTQSVPSRPEWTAYMVPAFTPGPSVHMAPAHAPIRKSWEGNSYMHQVDHAVANEFPERPGQPECSYFIKTGNCKYRSACKFHHPKSNPVKSAPYSFSDLGLPLRPGESICHYYSRYGICKYGPACKYDHPLNHAHSPTLDLSPGFGSVIVNNQAMAAGS